MKVLQKRSITWLDNARIISAFAVVVLHVAAGLEALFPGNRVRLNGILPSYVTLLRGGAFLSLL